jgi:hypothetical protein
VMVRDMGMKVSVTPQQSRACDRRFLSDMCKHGRIQAWPFSPHSPKHGMLFAPYGTILNSDRIYLASETPT